MTRTRLGCWWVVSSIVVGCGPRLAEKPPEPPVTVSESPSPALTAGYSMAHHRWPPDLQLTEASQLAPMPKNSLPVVISDSALWVGEPLRQVVVLPPRESRVEVGFGRRPEAPPTSRYVPGLASVVRPIVCGGEPRPKVAVLFVDRRVPSRLVFDALFTLTRGFERFYLAAVPAGGGSPGVLPFVGQEYLAHSIRVGIGDDGIGVRSTGHVDWLGGGCAPGVARPTIPLLAGSYDIDAAVDCVSSLPAAAGPLSLEMGASVYPHAYVTLLSTLARAAGGGWRTLTLQPQDDVGFLTHPVRAATGRVPNAKGVVESLREPFRDCYNRELARRSDTGGSLRLKLDIGASGTVTGVWHEGGEGLEETTACAARAAAKVQFEPPRGGNAVITIPLTFFPGDACWRP